MQPCQRGYAKNVGSVELPIAVRFQHTEDVTNNLLLPVNEFKGLSRPGAFGMAQALNEVHSVIRRHLIVMGSICHIGGRRVFLQLLRDMLLD